MVDELRYTVRRFNWRWAGTCFVRAPGEHRLTSFDTAEDANAEAWKREQEVRGRVNPFACGPAFHYLSTMPEPIYLDWLRDADITPPDPDATGKRPWVAWWDEVKPDRVKKKYANSKRRPRRLSESQSSRVWEGLNRVRFFDVIARRTSQVAYAVVRIAWDYNDNWYESGDEGGLTETVYRTRASAEARCKELEARERHRGWGRDWFGMRRWKLENWPRNGPDVGTTMPSEEVPVYEVVEIDLGSGE